MPRWQMRRIAHEDHTYYGHAAFLVEARGGTRLILDPYLSGGLEGSIGYDPITDEADCVIASHDHEDHAATYTIAGQPLILLQPSWATVGEVEIAGIRVFHDGSGGSERGSNTVVVLDDGEIRLTHLGDLGHELDAESIKAVGSVDVLLVPVGGFYTVDAVSAAAVVEALSPAIVIPMHYKTDRIDFPIAPVSDFLARRTNVEYRDGSSLELTREILPSVQATIVLELLLGRTTA